MSNGFTLIELLVVVLIIGILSAVAVPQYQKAVAKSRFANLKFLTTALAHAQELYYLHNGTYATNFGALDIETPSATDSNQRDSSRGFAWGQCDIADSNLFCQDEKANIRLQIYYKKTSTSRKGQWFCIAFSTDLSATENKVCKSETRQNNPINTTDTYVEWLYK